MIDLANTLHDLVTNTSEALSHASDVIGWLTSNDRDNVLRARLEHFVERPDLPQALALAPDIETLDAHLRHDAPSSPLPTHRLISRLGALKRLARDLRRLAGDGAPVHSLLDGSKGILDIDLPPIEFASLQRNENPRSAQKPAIRDEARRNHAALDHVLIVEDDSWWRKQLAAKAKSAFPQAYIETFATYQAARDRFGALAKQKHVLVILDLGLPDRQEGEPADDTSRGMELLRVARAYENLWRVIVVTRPRNYLSDHREATRAGVQPEDYIFKLDDNWESEIESSLSRIYDSGISSIEIAHGDALRRGIIRAGVVEFALDGRPLFILKSLAEMRNQSGTEEQLLDALEIYDEGQAAGFSDSLIKIRQAFVEAFAEVGRHLSPGDVIRTEENALGPRPVYRLVPSARVVDALDDAPRSSRATRALVVDDEASAATEEARWLKRLGLEVVTARCGDEATQLAATFAPHIICLDLALPWKSGGPIDPQGGLVALDAIRAQVGMADTRAVVVSAVAQDDRIRRAGLLRGIRVDDWLYKGDAQLESWVVRSCSRLIAEIERGVVLAARARSPWVLEISATKQWAALDGKPLWTGRSKGLWDFLKVLAHRPWLAVSVLDLEEALGIEDADAALKGRAKRLRRAAGEQKHDPDSFIKGIVGGYVLRATVRWVD